MEEKDTKILSFEVSAEEAQTVADAARELGISRSEYLRQRLLTTVKTKPENPGAKRYSENLIMLLQETLYGLQRTHVSLFGIANLSGVDQDELEKLSSDARDCSINYIANLEARIGETRQQVSAVQDTK